MGQIIKTCHLDWCDSDEKDKILNLKEHDSDWEGENGEYAPVEFNLFSNGTENPRKPKIYNFL